MFIPLHLNLPLIVGGLISHLVTHSSGNAELSRVRGERGTLLASGFIAGGALMGVVSAGLTFAGVDLSIAGWSGTTSATTLSILAYALIIIYLMRASMLKKIS